MAEAQAIDGTRFDASDDAAFQQLLDAHALPAGNALSTVKPTSLNLTADCWTTLDLQRVAYNGSALEEISRLSYIRNAVGPSLPQNVSSASLIDVNQYWNTLDQLNTTTSIVNGSIQQCNSTGFATPKLNFTANCSATGNFWWHNVNNLTVPDSYALDRSWLELFRASLEPPYQNLSDHTLLVMCQTVRNRNLQLKYDFLPPLQAAFETAAAECAPSACRSLGYRGSSDIVGAGSVIAYGFVAGVSTLLVATVAYFRFVKSKNSYLFRDTITESAVIFWDVMIWFGLLAGAAAYVYNSTTLYEYSASMLVNNLILNSAIMLVTLYHAQDEKLNTWTRILPQYAVYFLAASVNWRDYFRTRRWNFAQNFTDMPCYAAGRWPLDYSSVAVKFQLAILSIIMSWFAIQMLVGRYGLPRSFGVEKGVAVKWIWKRFLSALVAFATIAIWLDFAFIVLIRKRAREGFGASYEDDAYAFGQVISAGLAAQAIYAYLCAIAEYLYGSSSTRKASTSQAVAAPLIKSDSDDGAMEKKDAPLLVTVHEGGGKDSADIEANAVIGRHDGDSLGERAISIDLTEPTRVLPTRYTM